MSEIQCPEHWFGRTTSAKSMTAILDANRIPKAVFKSVKGMFGSRQRILERPGYELTAAHGTTPCQVNVHAANIHVGMTVCTTAPDTDALRTIADALQTAGILVRYHTFDREDFTLCVGKGQPPESFRSGDDAWIRWIRERMPRWYTETRPEWFARTTADGVALAKQSASDIRAKVSADLRETMKGIL